MSTHRFMFEIDDLKTAYELQVLEDHVREKMKDTYHQNNDGYFDKLVKDSVKKLREFLRIWENNEEFKPNDATHVAIWFDPPQPAKVQSVNWDRKIVV